MNHSVGRTVWLHRRCVGKQDRVNYIARISAKATKKKCWKLEYWHSLSWVQLLVAEGIGYHVP